MPKNAGTLDVMGTVRLQIDFLPTGEIGKVFVISPVATLTELAVEAAKRIKFSPQTKGGEKVLAKGIGIYAYSWENAWKPPAFHILEADGSKELDSRAESVLTKAIASLGGDRYLQIKNQVGKGKFSVIRDGTVISFQSFVDILVYPDKERTEFKGGGSRITQVNSGETGWVYDGDQELIKVQNEAQLAGFKQSIRTSLDNLLRGHWKGDAELTYVGKRPATLGKRNDVLRLTYKDGFVVEFEFAADTGVPQKAVYKRLGPEKEEIKEEDRYAQFIDVGGIKTPFIVDRFTDSKQSSRINYESIEYDKKIPDSIFAKPASVKEAKKEFKP